MTRADLHVIPSAPSTNSLLAAHAANRPHGYALMALEQTAGRGQRGNTWEAEPGANVTLSMLIRPHDLEARDQFALSEAVSLGITDTLAIYGVKATVKWPNDIYTGDRKICGILIENSLAGTRVERSIAGIGLNVNQTQWLSDAPNPVSIAMITGLTYRVEEVARTMLDHIMQRIEAIAAPQGRTDLHDTYMRNLWRSDGAYPYMDTASGQRFEAAIADVAPTGHITLALTDGTTRTYAFKEVAALL